MDTHQVEIEAIQAFNKIFKLGDVVSYKNARGDKFRGRIKRLIPHVGGGGAAEIFQDEPKPKLESSQQIVTWYVDLKNII
jgi:hypothetical protein